MARRRSHSIQLVTLGTVVLGACSDANLPKDRYAYQARPQCVQDWGEKNCEPAPARSGGSSGYFYGPRFNSIVETPSGKHIWSGNSDMPAIHPNTGQPMHSALNVSRGGFGRTGGSFSSSGS